MSDRQITKDTKLTEEEVQAAKEQLHKKHLFPMIDRYYADPIYNGQTYSLHSFIPCEGATPDKRGIYGFMKCRGCFTTMEEAPKPQDWLLVEKAGVY